MILASLAVAAAVPDAALACSTCMDPAEGSRTLLVVTIFLSLLPIGMLAAIGGYVWWRAEQMRRHAAAIPLLERP
ncbi:MAG: hypothetical protein EXR71_08790 [Myxococcales bacterium]|nr:hypothetical protein [Myxococcales bacterium]